MFLCCVFTSQLLAEDTNKLLNDCDTAIALFESYEKAESAASRIEAIARERGDKTLQARGMLRIAFCDIYFAHWRERPPLIDTARNILEKLPSSALARVELDMFDGFLNAYYLGRIQQGIDQLQAAAAAAVTLEDDKLLSQVYFFLGRVLPLCGRKSYAAECLNRSVGFARNGGFDHWERAALIQLLNMQSFDLTIASHTPEQISRISELSTALERPSNWHQDVFSRCEADRLFLEIHYAEIKEKNSIDTQQIGIECLNAARRLIGEYQRMDQWDVSAKYFDQAEHLCLFLQDATSLTAVYESRILYLCQKERFDALDQYLLRVLSHWTSQKKFSELHFLYSRMLDAAHIAKRNDLVAKWSKKTDQYYAKASVIRQAALASDNFVENTLRSRKLNLELRTELQSRDDRIAKQWMFIIAILAVLPSLCIVAWLWSRSRTANAERKRLKNLVKDQTHSLQIAKENAETANQAKTDFLARVNHELRNPLTALVCSCDLIQSEATENEKVQTASQTIHSCTKVLLDVIEDVLDFTRIESGQLTLSENNFSIREQAKVVESVIKSHIAKDVALRVEVAEEVPDLIFGDEAKLRQVLINLGMNAAKHTITGMIGYRIHCSSETVSADSISLQIQVQDTGCGIDDGQVGEVFDQYITAGTRPGSGLGLFISRAFVEQMGGTISVDSKKELGSMFTLKIPFKIAQKSSETATSEDSISQKKIRVMLVDDEQVNLRSISLILRTRPNLEVFTASLWTEMESHLRNNEIDLIFMDLRMPQHDGYELASRIKTLNLSRAPQVFAMTGDATEFTRTKTAKHGFDGFLAKPFSLNALLACIEQAQLAQSNSQRQSQIKTAS